MKKIFVFVVFTSLFWSACSDSGKTDGSNAANDSTGTSQDPLPSWNEGALKQAILSFVKGAIDSNSKTFVPIEDRIATFDNDGTLWAEKPTVQVVFAMERV